MAQIPNYYKSGAIVKVRLTRKRWLFKAFAVIQIRREQLTVHGLDKDWKVCGMEAWRDVNPNNLHEVHEAMSFLESLNAPKQTKQA
jgi:hypothetical protein